MKLRIGPPFAAVAGLAVAATSVAGPASANSAGEGVAVSPDSAKVFVTGDTGNDGATVAYNF
jgi:hypothetical protein